MSSVASKLARLLGSLLSALFVLLSLVLPVFSQTTVGTGSIVGTVTDPSGAVISGTLITITNTATGQTIRLFTNSVGEYNSGALLPGNYKIEVNAKGFISFEEAAAVQIGTTTAWNVVGKPKDVQSAENGTKLSRGANFRCLMSGTPITGNYIKAEGMAQHHPIMPI